MSKLKVGIIGLGVGEKHISAFDSHRNCEVIALCDFSEKKIKTTANRYSNKMFTKNSDDILDNPKIDIVSIASYDDYHFDQVKKAVRNGKHVFVEKPLCLFMHEAKEIRSILNNNPNVKLSSNLNLRTCPRFKRARKAVQTGEMGDVYFIEGDYLWGRIYKLTSGWRKNMDFYSIVYGAAVHIIDLIIWMTDMKPIEVQGFGNQIASSPSDFKYNDFACILMKFKNGTVAKVSANGGCVHPHFHQLSIYGTKKTFIHNILGGKWLEPDNSKIQKKDITEKYPAIDKKGQMITSFIDSILNPSEPCIATFEDVINTMSICFAAEKSIQKGKVVKVEYI